MNKDIKGFSFQAPLLDTISELCLNPSDKEGRALLIYGVPGSGKSVFLSQLYRLLEDKIDFLTAIRAELSNENDPEEVIKLFKEAESIAEPKVLILDSLDVLASGRMPELHRWLYCLNKLRKMPFVTAVCACRSFEAEHLYPLNIQDWSQKYPLELPDNEWIRKVIESTDYPREKISDNLLGALRVPLHLRLEVDILGKKGKISDTETIQSLYTKLFELHSLGEDESSLLGQVADKMVENKSVQIPLACITVPNQQLINNIVRAGIIGISDSNVSFFHQTLVDFILARDIINKGKSLRDFLLEYKQSIFVRPIIRHILILLRPIPRKLIEELEQIFLDEGSPPMRTHTKVGILANMASWPDPTEQETLFLLRIFETQGGSSLMSQFFARIPHKGWFPKLKDRSLIPSLKEEGIKKSVSLSYIQAIAKDYPNEVLDIALELLTQKPSRELEFFFFRLFDTMDQTKLAPSEKEKYGDLIERIVQGGFIEWYYEIQRLCMQLSKIDPERALSLFLYALQKESAAYNDLSQRTASNANSLISTLSFLDLLYEIEKKIPLVTLLKTADFLEDIFNKSHLQDTPDALLYEERDKWFGLDAFYEWFKNLALDFSKTFPSEAPQLIHKLKKSNWHTQRQLVYLCMLQAPQQYIGEIREHIYSILERNPDDPSPEHEDQLLLQLLSLGFTYLPQVDQQRIMAKINSLSFDDDLCTKIWVWRPLHHIPESLHTPAVKERLRELDRRFGPYRYQSPYRISGGHVVSPVPKTELGKMEPEALYEFLIANRNLKEYDWEAMDDVLLGGTEELASEAAGVMAEDLDKYQGIIDRLADSAENDIYLKWILAKVLGKRN